MYSAKYVQIFFLSPLRDLTIYRFGYLQGALEPIPYGHQSIKVLLTLGCKVFFLTHTWSVVVPDRNGAGWGRGVTLPKKRTKKHRPFYVTDSQPVIPTLLNSRNSAFRAAILGFTSLQRLQNRTIKRLAISLRLDCLCPAGSEARGREDTCKRRGPGAAPLHSVFNISNCPPTQAGTQAQSR